MKAIIMAAGKSTRCYPLTITTPKPLVKVANKEIIFYIMDSLVNVVDEIIIVVGYKSDLIIEKLGKEYKGIKLSYVLQKEQLGTGNAVLLTKDIAGDNFLILGGDDIFDKEDIINISKHVNSMLVTHSDNPQYFGCVEIKDNRIVRIVEKPKDPQTDLVNIGCYHFTSEFFKYLEKLSVSRLNEIEIVDAVTLMAKEEEVKHVNTKGDWLPNSYAWDFLRSNAEILMHMDEKVEGKVEEGATIKGKLILGKGSLIRSGAYLEGNVLIGENCTIGPNCFIRGSTTIGNNCRVGNAVEIKNSILMDGAKVGHLSYVGDSILGKNVNFGAGTITANLKHDNKNVKSMVKGQLIDSGLRKFGTIIGDNVHTGIHTSIYPGRKLWPNTTTLPGEIVKRDVS